MQDKRKLTIAHFIPWSGGGGTEIATLRMAEAAREQFRHVAFCLPEAEAVNDSFERLGFETVISSPPEPSVRHAARFYKESMIVSRQLKSIGADIAHFAEMKAAYHNSLAARLAGCRMICHVRNTYPHLNFRERLGLLPVHSFVFVSQEARRRFAIRVPDRKSAVIYDPIDMPAEDLYGAGEAAAAIRTAVRREFGIPSQCTLIGMVARVNPQKDYFTLASAAAEVLKLYPDTRFMVVGDNSQVELNRAHFAEVSDKLSELGIMRSFIFTGHRNDVSRLMAAMDISVLSTHREGFGLCIAESMAMGKPVVATGVGGLLEVIDDGVTGYLHDHGNSKQLAERIVALIADTETATRLGRAGQTHVRRSYSREAFASDLAKAYERTLNV